MSATSYSSARLIFAAASRIACASIWKPFRRRSSSLVHGGVGLLPVSHGEALHHAFLDRAPQFRITLESKPGGEAEDRGFAYTNLPGELRRGHERHVVRIVENELRQKTVILEKSDIPLLMRLNSISAASLSYSANSPAVNVSKGRAPAGASPLDSSLPVKEKLSSVRISRPHREGTRASGYFCTETCRGRGSPLRERPGGSPLSRYP